MLIFNCTKAAAEFFTCKRQGQKYSPIEPSPKETLAESLTVKNKLIEVIEPDDYDQTKPWHWLVHAIKVKRKNVLIAMDCQSRFSLVLADLKKGDDIGFLNLFDQHLITQVNLTLPLFFDDHIAIEESLDVFTADYNQCAFYQRGDRSTQAHINDVAWHVELETDKTGEVPVDEDAIGFEIFVNQLLRKGRGNKDYFEPREEFAQMWLQQFAHLKPNKAASLIEAFKENIRARNRARFEQLYRQADTEVIEHPVDEKESQQGLQSAKVVSLTDFVKRKKH